MSDYISVAQLSERQPGTPDSPAWLNDAVRGVISKLDSRKTKTGKLFYACVLRDTTGSTEVRFTYFQTPRFRVGDEVELGGQGIKIGEYSGKLELLLGTKATVNLVAGGHQNDSTETPAARSAPPEDDSRGSAPPPAPAPAPSVIVNSATASWATGKAFDYLSQAGIEEPLEFWRKVHVMASDFVRMHHLLERGALAPSVKSRMAAPRPSAPGGTAGGLAAPTPPREAGAPPKPITQQPHAPAPKNDDEDVLF